MRPLRIAHVNPSFHPAHSYGGPTESGLQTVTHLARLGHEVRVLTTDADGPERTTAVDTSVERQLEPRLRVRYCHRVLPESAAPRLLLELPALLGWADVVHLTAVYNFTTFPTLLARLAAGKPLVWTPRGAFLRWQDGRRHGLKAIWDSFARRLARKPFAIHTTSDREAAATRDRMRGIDVFVVENGVAIPNGIRHEPSDVLRLMTLGRIDPIKGLDLLLDALGLLRARSNVRWRLEIIGDGKPDYVAKLRARAAALGIAEAVRFVGAIQPSDRAERFAHADVLVAPSHSENFGLSIAEALAHAVPVIASRGTPWSGLEERGAGRWVENDPPSLATAIEFIARADRRKMGAAGRAWVAREHGWEGVARRLGDKFESLCAAAAAKSMDAANEDDRR